MKYYTITVDRHVKNRNYKALAIYKTKTPAEAKMIFALTYGVELYPEDINEGINIPTGFDDLLNEHVKKVIVKVKSNSEDAPPLVSYQNMIVMEY